MNIEHIYVFIFEGFSDWEIAYLSPELNKSEKVKLKYFTLDGLEITSVGGLRIKPDLSLKEINADEVSMLVLPGGDVWEKDKIDEIDDLVKALYSKGKTISAICGATTYLGQKGYLDDSEHTSNDLNYLKHIAPDYDGENNYKDEFAVTDKNIITANGTAPIEFARDIFKKIQLFDEEGIEKWFQLFKNGIWSE